MAITTAPTRSAFTAPPSTGESRAGGLRISSTTYQRRPWQIGLGVALVLVCAAVAGAVFQSSAKKVSILVAAKSLPAGTVLTAERPRPPHRSRPRATSPPWRPADPRPWSASSSTPPSIAGQVLVRQMLAATPQLASGEQVVGMLLKGDQMPSVPLVAGDTVHVVAVPQAGQGSTIGGTIGTTLVPSATVFAVGPATGEPDPVRGVGLPRDSRVRAATVTSYAAADQIGLSLVSEGSTK